MTREEILTPIRCVKMLEERLRAYYDQHQTTDCKCELCKHTELILALLHGTPVSHETLQWAKVKRPEGFVPKDN
jgi:hypothetical protein